MSNQSSINATVVSVIGLGYVGLPLAEEFSKSLRVIGFDVNRKKIINLRKTNRNNNLTFTDKPGEISQADFIILCVPTPVTESNEPNLTFIESAAKVTAQNMRPGCVVILESTVFPGVTEEVVKPILENESGLICGRDFKIAYSPERINPGDTEHSIDKVTKVVAGMDMETTELVAQLYRQVTPSVYKAKDIKTAEACKVVENIQRDVNIALMNEFALIFDKIGLSTKDVLDAASTKWNFRRYSPGLVGGHCIPVVPHYLVYKARKMGYNPQLITSGRIINDYIPIHIAEKTIRALKQTGKVVNKSKVLIMGLTYKENVADTRDCPVRGTIKALKEFGVKILGYDSLLGDVSDEFGIEIIKVMEELPKVDAVILTVADESFKKIRLSEFKKYFTPKPVLIDVKQVLERDEAEKEGFYYYAL